MLIFRKPLEHRTSADARRCRHRRRRPGGHGLCAAALAAYRPAQRAAIPTRSSAKKISTSSRRRARSASTASPARCLIRAPCANCFPDSKRKRRSMPKSRKKRSTFSPRKAKFKFPITPPPLRDHGNYVISLNRFVKWLGGKVEETGITIFTGFAGSELLVRRRSRDRRSHRRQGRGQSRTSQKSNFEPGYDLQAKVVILAEGTRGSLTKQLIARFDSRPRPQPANLRRRASKNCGKSPPAASRPAKSSTPWAGR